MKKGPGNPIYVVSAQKAAARGTSRHDTALQPSRGRPAGRPRPGATAAGSRAAGGTGPGVPLSIWPGLPDPGGAGDGLPCGGPVTTAAARRVIDTFSVPGDLVVAAGGCSPAVTEAAAAAGRRVLALVPDGRSGYPLPVPYPSIRLRPGGPALVLAPGNPVTGQAALAVAGCCSSGCCASPGTSGQDDRDAGLLYAACERVLRPGGVLAVIAGPAAPGGTLADTAREHGRRRPRRRPGLRPAHRPGPTPPSTATASPPPPPAPSPPCPPAAPSTTTCWSSPSPEENPAHDNRPAPSPTGAPVPAPASAPEPRLSVWADRPARRPRPAARPVPARVDRAPGQDAARDRRHRDQPATPSPGTWSPTRCAASAPPCVEAVHLGRDGLGIEYEDRWAALAAANVAHARRQGAAGTAEVIRGDARLLPGLLPPGTAGRAALVVTSPPYGPQRPRAGQGRAAARRGGRRPQVRQPLRPRPGQPRPPGAGRAARRVHPDPGRLRGAAAARRAGRGHRPALAPARRAGRPARRRHRRRRPRRPDPGRPLRRPARRAARRPADRPAVVLPARQPPPAPAATASPGT